MSNYLASICWLPKPVEVNIVPDRCKLYVLLCAIIYPPWPPLLIFGLSLRILCLKATRANCCCR